MLLCARTHTYTHVNWNILVNFFGRLSQNYEIEWCPELSFTLTEPTSTTLLYTQTSYIILQGLAWSMPSTIQYLFFYNLPDMTRSPSQGPSLVWQWDPLSSISLKDPIFCSFKCSSMHPCIEPFALLLPPHSIHRQLTSSFRVRYHLVSPVNYILSFAKTTGFSLGPTTNEPH